MPYVISWVGFKCLIIPIALCPVVFTDMIVRQCGPGYYSTKNERECLRCNRCPVSQVEREPCGLTQDTVCSCPFGYYWTNGKCKKCHKCGPGSGVQKPCTHLRNTVCGACPNGTYSRHKSARLPCKACKQCGPNEEVRRPCTSTRDTICGNCLKGYFRSLYMGKCWKCSYCYPDFPNLTALVPECSDSGNSMDYQCQPVDRPPYVSPTSLLDVTVISDDYPNDRYVGDDYPNDRYVGDDYPNDPYVEFKEKMLLAALALSSIALYGGVFMLCLAKRARLQDSPIYVKGGYSRPLSQSKQVTLKVNNGFASIETNCIESSEFEDLSAVQEKKTTAISRPRGITREIRKLRIYCWENILATFFWGVGIRRQENPISNTKAVLRNSPEKETSEKSENNKCAFIAHVPNEIVEQKPPVDDISDV